MRLSLLASLTLILFPVIASAVGGSFSYEGRAFDASGNPLVDANVSFKLQVRSPSPSDCLLYEETKSGVNLSNSNGFFTLALNDGTGSGINWGTGLSAFNKVFSNNLAAVGSSCSGGSYTAASSDPRILVISVSSSASGGSFEALPAITMGAVPFAIEATQIAGVGIGNIVTTATTAPVLNSTQTTNMGSVLDGSTGLYVTPSQLNTATSSITPVSGNVSVAPASGGITLAAPSTSYNVTISGGAASSSNTTGALVVNGGLGLSGNLNALGGTINAGNLNISSGANITGTLSSSSIAAAGQVSSSFLGSASTPTFKVGTSSGMFGPTSTTLGFATSGVEQMRIDSTGNVGIGTMNPQYGLDVSFNSMMVGADSGATSRTASTNKSFKLVAPTYYTTYPQVLMTTTNDNLNNKLAIGGVTTGAEGATVIQFFTSTAVNTPSANERMRIAANGNVGIGNPSPTSTLHLNGSFARNMITTTTNYTILPTDTHVITQGSAPLTITLPAAGSYVGREISIRNIASYAVTSLSANVVPIAGGAAVTSILPATAGKWVLLVSDGTNWQIQMGN